MRAMEMLSLFLVCFLLLLPVLVHGQDQTGFISIDCGIDEGSSYNDDTTSILYVSDAAFAVAGVNEDISSNFMSETLPRQLWNVRSFPQGQRNCYTLNPGKGNKYLIRASFMYGNYDSLDQVPEFGLYLGAEEWDPVKFQNESHVVIKEIIHIPPTDYIDVCLINYGSGTPFISALELRELDNSTYITQSGSLTLYRRFDVGSTSNQAVRYDNDVYDRIWEPLSLPDWLPISAPYTTGRLSSNNYKPPPMVMSTAVIPANGNRSFEFSWKPTGPGQEFYIYMHFAEVQDLQANQLRKFNILMNGGPWRGPIVPLRFTPTIANSSYPMMMDNPIRFTFNMTSDSTLPPILNALEIYMLKEFQQLPTHEEDVSAIKDIKLAYKIEKNWQGDPCLPLLYSWHGLNCSYDAYTPPHITSLNLSSSGLTGHMASSLSNLKSLEHLDLSNNSLTGQVPVALAQLTSLKTLNLYGNKLTGSVPSALLDRFDAGLLSLSVGGNPDLCSTSSCKTKKKNLVVPLVASIASFLVLLGAMVILWILRKHRRAFVAKPGGDGTWDAKNRKFSYSEIVSMTDNFQRVIGKGGTGTVYGGHLKDGTEVAVKMLSPLSTQGSKQFQTEAQLLTRVHHRNLASLIGYCDEGSNMGLIYEYMANGNLRQHLSGLEENAAILSWEQRLRIGVDAAQALEYLHNGCKPPIIHRDIKTANILLNEKLQAKVADFGLSRLLPFESGTQVSSTTVVGTFGYLDPEYYVSNRLNEKSDVYSFGIVLLELITGLPAVEISLDEPHIVQWVNPMLERGEIRNIIDPRLQGDFDTNSVWKALETAMACVPSISIQRPSMSHVVVDLKECLEMEITRKSSLRMRELQDPTSTKLSETVCLDIENSIGPQAR